MINAKSCPEPAVCYLIPSNTAGCPEMHSHAISIKLAELPTLACSTYSFIILWTSCRFSVTSYTLPYCTSRTFNVSYNQFIYHLIASLSLRLSVCLSIHPFIQLFINPCFYFYGHQLSIQSIHLPLNLFNCQAACVNGYLAICFSIHPFQPSSLYFSTHVSACLAGEKHCKI